MRPPPPPPRTNPPGPPRGPLPRCPQPLWGGLELHVVLHLGLGLVLDDGRAGGQQGCSGGLGGLRDLPGLVLGGGDVVLVPSEQLLHLLIPQQDLILLHQRRVLLPQHLLEVRPHVLGGHAVALRK